VSLSPIISFSLFRCLLVFEGLKLCVTHGIPDASNFLNDLSVFDNTERQGSKMRSLLNLMGNGWRRFAVSICFAN